MSVGAPRRGELRIGTSAAMRDVDQQIDEVAATKQPVLIQGETGTGKEVVAREIHARSPRCGKPWIVVNCASLAPESAESELNGHISGAFTGASTSRQGLIKSANGGTLFLDEVAELPPSVQSKLLRTLEDGSVRAFGADKTDAVNVRFIAATSANLKERAAAGRFKSDLIARFGNRVMVPPLRDRAQDLAELASEFVTRLRNEEGMNPAIERVSAEAIEALKRRKWPENVRGLRHAVARALARSRGSPATELGLGHFDTEVPEVAHKSECLLRAQEALREVGRYVLENLESKSTAVATIEVLAKSHPELSLLRAIADAFYERYPTGREAKAKSLFGYRDLEAVRRLRTKNNRDPE